MWTTLKFRAKANQQLDTIPRVTQIRIEGYFVKTVDLSARRVKLALDLLGVKSTGIANLPRKRTLFNVLKNPHKWKKHQELWEMRTHTRVITMEASVKTSREVIDYILQNSVHPGAEVRLRRLAFEPLDKWWKNPYLHLVEIERDGHLEKIRASKANKIDWSGDTKKAAKYTGSVLHITKDGDVKEVVSKVDSTPDFSEPGVLDADVVYDDSYYKFDDGDFKKWDNELDKKLQALVSLCRAKAHGEDIDELDVRALLELAEEKVQKEQSE
eukprot:TRINITY_DN15266_c0_g1_i1.p1 TRINITY_DN15266_c0_g1~~TRINITY_DN15266_c0_g1_i1.p1  ORF type:complete len:270 (+),score=62.80 TRINITY_DN15266_c0_g1_i1:179-988(+)